MLISSTESLAVDPGQSKSFRNAKTSFEVTGDGKCEPEVCQKIEDSFEKSATEIADFKKFAKAEGEIFKKLLPYRKPDGSKPTRVGKRMRAKAFKGVEKQVQAAANALPGEGWNVGQFFIHNDGEGYTLDFEREANGV